MKSRIANVVVLIGLLVVSSRMSVWAYAPGQESARAFGAVSAYGPDKQEGEPADPTAKRETQVQGNNQEVRPQAKPQSIISEGFEGGVVPPTGWTHVQTNVNETWEISTYAPHSGTYYATVLYDSNLLDQDEVLLSPTFTAGQGSVALWSKGSVYWCRDDNDNCDLEVWLVNGAWGGGDDVRLGLADDSWTDSWVWSYSTFDFNASGNPVRIALRYVGNDGAQVGVDDIVIDYSEGGGSLTYLPLAVHNFCPAGTLTPDDPGYSQQWGMDKINVPRAWFCGFRGSSVVVAVIDTGVDIEHPEFAGKLVGGWDWANNDSNADDDHGHGSHVAGVVGAIGNNGVGVSGVAWNTKIMPLKTLDADGSGYTSWSADAIIWATDHGAHIINMSLGSVYYSKSGQDAVNYAHSSGVLVVASAGNCGDSWYWANGCNSQDQPSYPGAYDNVMAVASTTQSDGQSSFSTQGSYVDIAAPGSDIYSTEKDGGYGEHAGTSQASPHVAGLAALIKAAHSDYTPDQIATAMQTSAVDLGSSGRDDQFGWGRINAAAALHLSPTTVTAAESASGPAEAALEAQPLSRDSEVEFAPGVVLVKLRPQVSASAVQNTLAGLDGEVQLAASLPQIGLSKLSVPVGSEWDVIESLRALPQVEYAEPDLLIHLW